MKAAGNVTRLFHEGAEISSELADQMMIELGGFILYMIDRHLEKQSPRVHKFLYEHDIPKDKIDILALNLALAEHFSRGEVGHAKRYMKLYGKKGPHQTFTTSWLRECERALPKFYYVADPLDGDVIRVLDLESKTYRFVYVNDSEAEKAQKGALLAGMLIPLGKGLHTTFFDFYHFEYVEDILAVIAKASYQDHKQHSSPYEAFFLALSETLQMDRHFLGIDLSSPIKQPNIAPIPF
ncbi:hypothetical protein H0266_14995 [Halobacillus locisalis]|uniref:Uncharacterized protein n=1 Tax=Halobacillus locisalis TaxID=220753 RepID=A0A838CVM6_9BACI|nr:hypothetical protein [Halobacillus locisalis]MBA2176202.1 hypothetical protein [Halobacillus locisalis]